MELLNALKQYSRDIYLPVETQNALIYGQRGFFILTSLLNVISMRSLLKETPPNQITIRTYLLFIQLLIILSSVYLDVLFAFIPTFPAIAGYCLGLLCIADVRPHSVLGIFILLVVLTGMAIISCIFYRHQIIVPVTSRFHFRKTTCFAIQALITIVIASVPIAYTLYPFEKDEMMKIINQSPYNLSWIASRGPFFIHERSDFLILFINDINLGIASTVILGALLFLHMIYVLSNEKNRSPSSIKRTRRSVLVLFVQLAAPLTTIDIPVTIMFTSMACECIPFNVTLPAYCVFTFHPLVHNIILLSITPSYRRSILSAFEPRKKHPSTTIQISSVAGT